MKLGVDECLTWSPARLSAAANWLDEMSTDMEMTARAVRNASEDGTADQCGPFVESRRSEAAELVLRIDRLAVVARAAAECIDAATAVIEPAVTGLREAERAMRDGGFDRGRGDIVTDTRTKYDDATERLQREAEADAHTARLREFLDVIRAADEEADVALHAVVDRDVRDRTARGNGAPSAIIEELFAVLRDQTTVPSAAGSTGMQILREVQDRFASERGVSLGWWSASRGGGPLLSVLGFAGAVANAPDDEPLHETLWAEGAGTVGGVVGSAVGFLLGGGPNPVGFGGHFVGGVAGS